MKQRIVFLTSHPMSVVAFMLPHIRALKPFFDVQVMANATDATLLQQQGVDILIEPVVVVRPISLLADLKALMALYWRFKRGDFSAVHTITPKAGLLGMAAAWAARVPVRIHSFTGQVWVTRTGLMRWLLRATDKLIATLATDVLVDSPSQRDFLIEEGVLIKNRSTVLGAGSICGVDTQRFHPDLSVRSALRAEIEAAADAQVCLYLGRVNRDKGVLDFSAAFAQVAVKKPNTELWVVGPDEEGMFAQMMELLEMVSMQVRRVDFTKEPERFMQAADLFCLPSYREGFGSSVIEAAACGIPALVSRIYGLTDAVEEGETGWMHEAGNIQDLTKRLDAILQSPEELLRRGEASRGRAQKMFEQGLITNAMVEFYQIKLKACSEHR